MGKEIYRPKAKITSAIICSICGQFSGWRNSDLQKIDLSKIVGIKELKCENCGEVCITIKGKSCTV